MPSAAAADGGFWSHLLYHFRFAFTLEQTLLQLISSCLTLAFCFAFVIRHHHEPVRVRPHPLLWAKVTLSAALIACQAATLRVLFHTSDASTNAPATTASLELLALLSIAQAVYIGHKHATYSSGIVAVYLFSTLLIETYKSHVYSLAPDSGSLSSLASASAIMRLLLLLLEEIPKTALLVESPTEEASALCVTGGYLTRLLVPVFNPMRVVSFGDRIRREDLVTLGLDFTSDAMHLRLQKEWKRTVKKPSRHSLVRACARAWKRELYLGLFLQITCSGFSYAHAFLMEQVITVVDLYTQGKDDEVTKGRKLRLQAAAVFIFGGMTLSHTASTYLKNRMVAQMRAGLVALLMEKTHYITTAEATRMAILTHMNVDIETITEELASYTVMPAHLFEIPFGIFLLSRFIQHSAPVSLVPGVIALGVSLILGRFAGPTRAKWNESIRIRVTKTTEVLNQLPRIKMLGLGPTVRTMIRHLRVKEMRDSRSYRFVMALLNTNQEFVDVGSNCAVIGVSLFWHGFDGTMAAAKLFPTIFITNQVVGHLLLLVTALCDFGSMAACFDRIQYYLQLPERTDSRIKWDPSANIHDFGSASNQSGPGSRRGRSTVRSPAGAIQFADASFGPVETNAAVLSDVKLKIPRGTTLGVLGRTSSGKSTFFRSILGETKNYSGFVYTDSVSIAYCGENVWLKDVSIQENIIGYLPFDPVRYALAIQRCQLEPDLALLPNGDNFRVGPDGSYLSGGQRQRVALARAAFSRCEIAVIDNGLNSVDNTTARAILQGLCGQDGILTQTGCTVVLSTDLPEILQVADQIVTLDGDGQVVPFRGLLRGPEPDAAIASFLNLEPSSASDSSENPDVIAVQRPRDLDPELPSRSEEEYVRQHGSWGLYMLLIDSIGRFKFLLLCAMPLVLGINEAMPEVYLFIWSEKYPSNREYYSGYLLLNAVCCIVMGVSYWLLYTFFAVKAAVVLHDQILDVTMGATLGFLTDAVKTDLISCFSEDSDLFSKVLLYYLYRVLYVGSSALAAAIYFFASTSYMVVMLPIVLISVTLIQRAFTQNSRDIRHLYVNEKIKLNTFLRETATGNIHLQAFGWQQSNMEKGHSILGGCQEPFYLQLCLQQWLQTALDVLGSIIAIALVALAVEIKNATSGPAIGLALLNVQGVSKTMTWFVAAVTGSQISTAGLARLAKYKAETPQEPEPAASPLPEDWPATGDVEITGVSARYTPAVDVPPTVRDISLAIDDGERIGLTGRSGSGKSSLLLTLLGFLKYSGTVEIDGVDIATIPPDLLRSRIISITQDPVHFDDTIRKNLLPFTMNEKEPDMSDAARMQELAAKDAMLTDVLRRLNIWDQIRTIGGLDAMLKDVNYSKGELQLLCIARAIVRRYETGINLVLVDEATSGLDPLREAATQTVMDEVFHDCTVITVAHKGQALQSADCTIELAGGRVVRIVQALGESDDDDDEGFDDGDYDESEDGGM